MKKTIMALAAFAAALFTASAQGEVSYFLPQTVIKINVSATRQLWHAAPYARYAKELLGMDVILRDSVAYSISEIKLTPAVEADQSKRYTVSLSDNNLPAYLNMSDYGLISCKEGVSNDYGARLSPSPISTQRPVRKAATASTMPDSSAVAPVDPLYLEARQAAEKIKEYRQAKYDILIGNTDATYDGEALKTAINELNKMEGELLPLFVGSSSTEVLDYAFEVVPEAAETDEDEDCEVQYLAFRLSSEKGLLPAFAKEGRPFYMVVAAEFMPADPPIMKKHNKKVQDVHYRIPAICKIKMYDNRDLLLETRMPVYQLGIETTYPLYN